MPTTHSLHLHNTWYDQIASGQKQWEGRLNDSEVSSIETGDVIEFVSENRKPLKMSIIGIVRFPDFEKMLEGRGLQRLLPGIGSIDEGLEIYRAFPSYREGERTFGAVIFEMKEVVKDGSQHTGRS